MWVEYRRSWTSVSPLPHPHPLGWQVCLVLGLGAAPGHQVILFPPMGHGHPQEHGPGVGQGQHARGWGRGTDMHLPALCVMFSPLCIPPAALERCALVPAPSPHQGGRRQGHGKLVLGQNLRVRWGGRCLRPTRSRNYQTLMSSTPCPRCVSGTCPLSPTPCHQSSPFCGSSMERQWPPRTLASPMAL